MKNLINKIHVSLKSYLVCVFSIDIRSLALFRILLAFNLILDLYYSCNNLTAFYTDQGILPRDIIIQAGPSWRFSLNYINGSFSFQVLLFALSFVFSLGLLLGYKTRFCSIMSYVLFVSLIHRNPFVLNASDRLQAIMMLWCILLPVGKYFSIDSLLSKSDKKDEHSNYSFFSLVTVGTLLHFASVYLLAAFYKDNPEWQSYFTAVWKSIHMDYIIKYPATILREYPDLCSMFTVFVYYLEMFAILFLFFPFKNQYSRLLIVLLLSIMQLGFYVFFEIGLFPIRVITLHSIFLPGLFWKFLKLPGGENSCKDNFYYLKSRSSVIYEILAVTIIVIILSSKTVRSVAFNSDNYSSYSQKIVNSLRIDSRWNMFRSSSGNSTLTLYEGLTIRNEKVDIRNMEFGEPEMDPFKYSYPWYPDYRWRKVIGYGNKNKNKTQKAIKANIQYWFCRRWNQQMGEQNRLQKVRNIYLKVTTTKPSGSKEVTVKKGAYRIAGYGCGNLKYKK